jgi:hypothetical protein
MVAERTPAAEFTPSIGFKESPSSLSSSSSSPSPGMQHKQLFNFFAALTVEKNKP